MRKIKLSATSCRKLIETVKKIAQYQSKQFDFKGVMMLQKACNDLIDQNKDYIDKFNSIMVERDALVSVGGGKVSEYRQKIITEGEKTNASISEEDKKGFDDFQRMIIAQVNDDIKMEVLPKISKLDDEFKEVVEFELSDDKSKSVASALESFGLEYESPELITQWYDALTLQENEV